MILTGAQIRAARALIGITRSELAYQARLHPNAVKYWEVRDTIPRYQPYAVGRIERCLERLGVVAFADPHPGVRLSILDNFA
mgnify:CR=1 FL=1